MSEKSIAADHAKTFIVSIAFSAEVVAINLCLIKQKNIESKSKENLMLIIIYSAEFYCIRYFAHHDLVWLKFSSWTRTLCVPKWLLPHQSLQERQKIAYVIVLQVIIMGQSSRNSLSSVLIEDVQRDIHDFVS